MNFIRNEQDLFAENKGNTVDCEKTNSDQKKIVNKQPLNTILLSNGETEKLSYLDTLDTLSDLWE